MKKDANLIKWVKPSVACVGRAEGVDTFCGMDAKQTLAILGLDTYMERYGRCDGGVPDLTQDPAEFADWQIVVPFSDGDVIVLCCPEDRVCQNPDCGVSSRICSECRFPICRECETCLYQQPPKMPAVSLANDMMIFYAPREIYVQEMTVMELICSSVCITSMICLFFEVKFGNLFDTKVHMHRHRVGARGNATSFLMPWQALLAELQRLDQEQQKHREPDLPHTGADLVNIVQILLKTNDDQKRAGLVNYIHQARVRRAVVVQSILDAKRRKHRAYILVDEVKLRRKAENLPEDGVPPELLRLLAHDNDLDKLQVQKAATPVEGRREDLTDAARAFASQSANAVVHGEIQQ